jgi:hypothetical protein
MFWNRKKESEKINDPVTKYGKMVQDKKQTKTKSESKKGFFDRLFKGGHDSGFVYWDE